MMNTLKEIDRLEIEGRERLEYGESRYEPSDPRTIAESDERRKARAEAETLFTRAAEIAAALCRPCPFCESPAVVLNWSRYSVKRSIVCSGSCGIMISEAGLSNAIERWNGKAQPSGADDVRLVSVAVLDRWHRLVLDMRDNLRASGRHLELAAYLEADNMKSRAQGRTGDRAELRANASLHLAYTRLCTYTGNGAPPHRFSEDDLDPERVRVAFERDVLGLAADRLGKGPKA